VASHTSDTTNNLHWFPRSSGAIFPLFECKNRKAQSAAMDDTSIVMDDHFRSSVKYILLSFVCSVDFLLGDSLME